MKNNNKVITTLVVLICVAASNMQCTAITKRLFASALTAAPKRIIASTASVARPSLLRSPSGTRLFSGKVGGGIAPASKVSGDQGSKGGPIGDNMFFKYLRAAGVMGVAGGAVYGASSADEGSPDNHRYSFDSTYHDRYSWGDRNYVRALDLIDKCNEVLSELQKHNDSKLSFSQYEKAMYRLRGLVYAARSLLSPEDYNTNFHRSFVAQEVAPVLKRLSDKLNGYAEVTAGNTEIVDGLCWNSETIAKFIQGEKVFLKNETDDVIWYGQSNNFNNDRATQVKRLFKECVDRFKCLQRQNVSINQHRDVYYYSSAMTHLADNAYILQRIAGPLLQSGNQSINQKEMITKNIFPEVKKAYNAVQSEVVNPACEIINSTLSAEKNDFVKSRDVTLLLSQETRDFFALCELPQQPRYKR